MRSIIDFHTTQLFEKKMQIDKNGLRLIKIIINNNGIESSKEKLYKLTIMEKQMANVREAIDETQKHHFV